jgi:hypothetical protein
MSLAYDPAPAWARAREILDYMSGLFGEPAEIARGKTIGPIGRRLLRDWLPNIEWLVSRLLVLAAFGLVLAPVRPGSGSARKPRPLAVPSDDPAQWAASLRLFRKQRAASARACCKPDDDSFERGPADARPFARRLEALRRIVDNPDRRIRLAARTLSRMRAANARTDSPREFTLKPWLIPRARRTDAQEAIHDVMLATEPPLETYLARWQEPG